MVIPSMLIAMTVAQLAQGQPAPAPPARSLDGPWNGDIGVYRIGARGDAKELFVFERGGVSTVARLKDGRLACAFQHFPTDSDQGSGVAVSYSADQGESWTAPVHIEVTGMPEGYAAPFDPTLVPQDDGKVRLYFTSNQIRDFRRSTPSIHSAISDDALHYRYEPGIRLAIDGRIVIDCAVASRGGVVHLLVPDNGSVEEMTKRMQTHAPQPAAARAYHATSKDGLTFTRTADTPLRGGAWLGCAVDDASGILFFGTGAGPWPMRLSGEGVGGQSGKWEAAAESVRLPGADPGAVRLASGEWLVTVTIPSKRHRTSPPASGGERTGQSGRQAERQGSLRNGDEAPAFTLASPNGKATTTLKDLRGKPTVIVFGSCTCPPFVRSIEGIDRLAAQYRDRVNFLLVYIREAHPTDGNPVRGNQFAVATPRSLEERCKLAEEFDRRIGVDIPIVVDGIDDATLRAYSPWPNRMVIVDAAGRIADVGSAGPQGTTDSAKAAGAVLERLLR